jgi:flagellar biogenesis protein FliO
MSVMDALGYLGVFVIFLVAEFAPAFESYLQVYNALGQVFGWLMLALYVFSAFYFFVKLKNVLFGSTQHCEEVNDKGLLATEKTYVVEVKDNDSNEA